MASLDSAEGTSLQEQFLQGWEAQKTAEKGDLNSSSAEFKACVSRGIALLEGATVTASQLDLFSRNEQLEEVPSGNLRYLLLPALLGDLTLQLTDGERRDVIAKVRVYLVDYLQRCRDYAITSEDPPPPPSEATPTSEATPPAPSGTRSFQQLADERAAKIARYKAQRETERKLEELTGRLDAVTAEGRPPDDELVREHYLTLLQLWVHKCQQLVRSIDQEAEMLEQMEKMRGSRGNQGIARQPEAAPPPTRPPMKPVVITREMLQGGVFGAGYPSLPTVSLEQFFQEKYQQQVEEEEEGKRRQQAGAQKQRVNEEEEEEEEKEEEEEEGEGDGEALKKAREFDDYKDDHRKGWGNRKNMG